MEKAYSLEGPPKAEYPLYEQGLYGTSPALRHPKHNSYTYEIKCNLFTIIDACSLVHKAEYFYSGKKLSLFNLSLIYNPLEVYFHFSSVLFPFLFFESQSLQVKYV
jgi:hypothetical protein